MTQAERDTLEALIDRHTLIKVLAGIAEICADKADHIRVNWQDKVTAKHWDRASKTVGTAARGVGC